MRRALLLCALAAVACTDVTTDPNTVVALRFAGAAYPSIVIGDSLRDSLGAIQVLRATGLNFRGDSVPGTVFDFSSPDTSLKLFQDGVVFARTPRADPTQAAIVYARTGPLLSQADSLFVVPRADLLTATKAADTVLFDAGSGGSSAQNVSYFQVLGDTGTTAGAPKAVVRGWLVSFQLRYHDQLIPVADTSFAFTGEVSLGSTPIRFQRATDTSDASGLVGHRLFVKSLAAGATEDTIFVVGTARRRKANTDSLTAETMFILRRR
jgi:hypothetical protein